MHEAEGFSIAGVSLSWAVAAEYISGLRGYVNLQTSVESVANLRRQVCREFDKRTMEIARFDFLPDCNLAEFSVERRATESSTGQRCAFVFPENMKNIGVSDTLIEDMQTLVARDTRATVDSKANPEMADLLSKAAGSTTAKLPD